MNIAIWAGILFMSGANFALGAYLGVHGIQRTFVEPNPLRAVFVAAPLLLIGVIYYLQENFGFHASPTVMILTNGSMVVGYFVGRRADPIKMTLSSSYNDYQSARDIYDRHCVAIGLSWIGPTSQQSAAAREVTALTSAKEMYLRALAVSSGYNRAAVHFQLGLLYRLWGRFEEAAAEFERALADFQSNLKIDDRLREAISQSHFYIGQTLLDCGDREGAGIHLRKAQQLDESMATRERRAPIEQLLRRCDGPT